MKYPSSQNCETILRFKERTPFRIEFIGIFEIEYGYKCGFDFIEIRSGEYADSPLIMKECGSEKPQTLTLMGSSVWIRFVSDFYSNYNGFLLKITKVTRSECKNQSID